MASGFLDEVGESPSRSLTLACGAFCAGIAIGPLLNWFGNDAALFGVLLLAIPILFLRGKKSVAGIVVCAALAGGIARSLIPLVISVPIPTFVTAFRDWIVAILHQLAPEPDASFLSGLIFGGQSSLPHDLRDAFRTTGTSHILSASGFNVSVVSTVFLNWVIQTPLGRKRGIAITFALLVAYVLAAGATPAVVRAGVMASTLLVGMAVRRRASATNVLLLAASLMLIADPSVIADVGFQLSFVATAAIMFASDRFAAWLAFLPERFGIRESFAASLAAILATFPIVLWHFGTASLVAPLANLLVLPLVPYAMAFAFAALAVGIVDVRLGAIAVLPALGFAWLILWLVTALAAVPYASVQIPLAPLVAAFSAVACAAFFFWLVRRPLAKP